MHKLQEGWVHTVREYRIRESIGNYWNKRYIVQEKYSYYENGKKVESWHMVFSSPEYERCEEVLQRRIAHNTQVIQ